MKKLLSVLLIAVVALGVFAGCAAKEEPVATNAPEANAPAQSTEALVQEPASEQVEAPVTEAPAVEPDSQVADSIAPVQAAPSSPSNVSITADEAKAIALSHAGFTADDVRGYRSELDRERNRVVYEIEFVSGNYEYDYEIDAESGAVVKAEKEFND